MRNRIALLFVVCAMCLFAACSAQDIWAEHMHTEITDNELREIVRTAVYEFADSQFQENSDKNAAKLLGDRGFSGSGEPLTFYEGDYVTSAIWSAELSKQMLTDACTEAIRMMRQTSVSSLTNPDGVIIWREDGLFYRMYTKKHFVDRDPIRLCRFVRTDYFEGETNSYDNSLIWIIGGAHVWLDIYRTVVTDTDVTYQVVVKFSDTFDFHIDKTSGFTQFASIIGECLFEEFYWTSEVSFDIKVPYKCSHGSGVYSWNYDPVDEELVCDTNGKYKENSAIRHSYINDDGNASFYYELSEPIRLYHDKPWVIEYDVKNPKQFSLSPFESTSSANHPALIHRDTESLFFRGKDFIQTTLGKPEKDGIAGWYYGTLLSDLLDLSDEKTYTFRLKNSINSKGKNVVYLTIIDTQTGKTLVKNIPMNDKYDGLTCPGNTELVDDNVNWMNGKDWFINFIGNRIYGFGADYFALRIWEEGTGSEGKSYFQMIESETEHSKTYICSVCGYNMSEK